MVFAAPSAMWLYCTGTVFGRKGRLLTTEQEKKRKWEGRKPTENQKSTERKNEMESLRRKERNGEEEAGRDEQTSRSSPLPSTLFLLVLHFQAWSPLKWMAV